MTPDDTEQGIGDQTHEPVPAHGASPAPVVGVGASGQALELLAAFLRGIPQRSGMAFVLVLHPAADPRLLEPMLRACTAVRTVEIRAREFLEPDVLYVVPPAKALRALGRMVEITGMPPGRSRQFAIDLVLRALADAYGTHAVAVLLGDTRADGVIGLRRIRERGGLTIALDDHTPAPGSGRDGQAGAAAPEMIDWLLPAADVGAQILAYFRTGRVLELPPERGEASPDDPGEASLREVMAFVHSRTSRDLASYKRATVLRRIGRRMQLCGTKHLPAYLDCLRSRPAEAESLLHDMLVSVTNFFRDADSFAALEHGVPELFHGKQASDVVRVWVVACATGEEAYSVAMLLAEQAARMASPPAIQVFATDLDEASIRTARRGLYPGVIGADVGEARLNRFFLQEPLGYRVRRELREMVLFTVHDVLKDPPFSRIDLASCRNLLIYLRPEAQARVFETLHFALAPHGQLFLGATESVDEDSARFSPLDSQHRLYRARSTPRTAADGADRALSDDASPALPSTRSGAAPAFHAPPSPLVASRPALERGWTWGELHLGLLDRLAGPSILLDAQRLMLHVSPAAARFLYFEAGEPSREVLKAVLPPLRGELLAALQHLERRREAVSAGPVRLSLGSGEASVSVHLAPVGEIEGGALLRLLDADAPAPVAPAPVAHVAAEPVALQLAQEVERLRSQLQDTVEQYETSTEELKSSNEELQAINEELNSATEELEAGREELQSINEELLTVNHELNSRVDDLGRAHSDILNLMAATAIAIVFLDTSMRLTRFTPDASKLFRLVPADIGRRLSDIATVLDYPQLAGDAAGVLASLQVAEREIGDSAGRWYLARARPYRTVEDQIAGVVLTFVDITERKEVQEALRQSQERFSAIVNQASVGVARTRLDGELTLVNRCYCDLLGYGEAELMGRLALDLVHPADRPRVQALFNELALHGKPFQIECRNLRRDGSLIWLHKSVTVLTDAHGQPGSALIICNGIGERKAAEAALRDSEERLRLVLENAVDHAIFSMDLARRVMSWNTGAERLLGYTEQEILGQSADLIFTEEDRAAGAPEIEARTALAEGRAGDDRLHQRQDGSRFWASGALLPMHNGEGAVVGLVKVLRDQTEQRLAQQEIEQSRAELLEALLANESARQALEQADATKDRFLAVLSHELRNPLASIHASAELLARGAAEAHEQRRAAQVIARQASLMKVLLGDLLDVSSLRRGRMVLRRVATSGQQVARAAVESAMPVIEQGRHILALAISDEPMPLEVDPIRLTQVLSNLLANAAKYTPAGGRLSLAARPEQGHAVFEVSDNGIGMEQDAIDSMFEMFRQSEQAHAMAAGGLGIGLALVRTIVDMHGGEVRGESAGLGQGSRFTVRIPLSGERADAGGAPGEAAEPARTAARLKVLLADDNADALWGMARMLSISGFSVETAENGPQALVIAERFRPDAAVLDIGMPGLSGHEVARRIRAAAWGRHMLLVAATGWGQPEDKDAALAAGFDEHLVKPIAAADLQRLLRARGLAGGEANG